MINFANYDSKDITSEIVEQFENALGEKLQPSDERRIFLNTLAQVVIGLKATVNDTGNQVLLRYARGEALDAIGEVFGVERLVEGYAMCVLEFSLSSAQSTNVTIPKGTRATPDGKVYFATNEALTISAGNTTGTVGATALTAGSEHNGYEIGQIKYIVDYVPYLSGVANTTVSANGNDGESDDNYRERIRLAPESFSTAGCEDGYIFWTKSADASIDDVSVTSESAGEVSIYVKKADGTVLLNDEADEDVIAEWNAWLLSVQEKVSAKDKRPLTDKVSVLCPELINYEIAFEYYIAEEDTSNKSAIQAKVRNAVREYVKWQSAKIGRDINPDKLRSLVLNAGASRVTVTSPSAFVSLEKSQLSYCQTKIDTDEDIDKIAVYVGTSE